MSFYRYLLPGNLQATRFASATNFDLQFKLAPNLLAALDANECVRDYGKAFGGYLFSADSAAFFCFHSVSVSLTNRSAAYEKND